MSFDVWNLIERDHRDLEQALLTIGRQDTSIEDTATALDAVRLGFVAHASAEERLLRRVLDSLELPAPLQFLVAQIASSHRAQEKAIHSLIHAPIRSETMRARARHLHALLHQHGEHERACLVPALHDFVPRETYDSLAPSYATQRLCLLTCFGERPASSRRQRRSTGTTAGPW